MDKRTCVVDGCDKLRHYHNGLCPMHYQRMRKNGTTDLVLRPPKPRVRRVGIEPCSIDECKKPIKARGWCAAHLSKWARYGSPTAQRPGEIVDGTRICPGCQLAVPVADWYVRPDGRYTRCRDCFGEWNRARANRRRAGVDGEHFTRADVVARDGWVCGICSQQIDPGLKHPHPMSVTLDHVIPLSRGGLHTMANSQPAHRICNQRKWAHLPSEKAG